MAAEPHTGHHSLVGERIGSYLIKRELARGGMGVVYEAVHAELGQRAVVKVLAQSLLVDPNYQEFVARFFDEARAITRIPHPSIVKVFDQGQFPDGTVYILMEYLDGEPLSRRIERFGVRGGMPVLEAIRIARQIASAIAEAHHKSILHRDLKPGNVILVRDADSESGERAKIIDFGIARLVDTPQRRTRAGTVMGTPLYMAPEQCRGEDVDERADVYAVGAILYEMLCGKAPFADAASVMVSKNMLDPQPLAEQRSGLPVTLYQLLDVMLQRERGKRPRMDAVVARLRQLESDLAKSESRNKSAQTVMAIGAPAMLPSETVPHPSSGMEPPSSKHDSDAAGRNRASSSKLMLPVVLLLSVALAGILVWFVLRG